MFLTCFSARRCLRIIESAFFDISDVLFCAQESHNSWKSVFLETVLPQDSKLPGTSDLFKKTSRFFRTSSAPGSEAARDKWLVQKNKSYFEKKFCPGQRSCPGQVACSRKKHVLRNSSAPGSEAARDKWLVQKKHIWEKVLPQAAKLPRTSGLYKKESCFEKKFCPGQRSCPGQVAC